MDKGTSVVLVPMYKYRRISLRHPVTHTSFFIYFVKTTHMYRLAHTLPPPQKNDLSLFFFFFAAVFIVVVFCSGSSRRRSRGSADRSGQPRTPRRLPRGDGQTRGFRSAAGGYSDLCHGGTSAPATRGGSSGTRTGFQRVWGRRWCRAGIGDGRTRGHGRERQNWPVLVGVYCTTVGMLAWGTQPT